MRPPRIFCSLNGVLLTIAGDALLFTANQIVRLYAPTVLQMCMLRSVENTKKNYAVEQHTKAQQKAFAHVKEDKSLSSMKTFASMRVVDDKVKYVPLSASGTPTKRGDLEPDEWEHDGSGHLVQAQTSQKLSINNDLPESGQRVGFSYKYSLPFCDGAINKRCARADHAPLLYLKYSDGKKYRSCGPRTASKTCKGCGAFCNSHDLCKGDKKGSCNKILSGSHPEEKKSHTFSTAYYCRCKDNSCEYKRKCRKESEVEKKLCLDSDVAGAPGIVTCDTNSNNQRWSVMDYRTTWQPREGHIVYKKGPTPVKHKSLNQFPTCSIDGGSFSGHIQDRIFTEKGVYDTTGTVNGLQSLISWNTKPPAYWTKDESKH